jgi:fatty acid synthase subunit alpha
MVAGGAHTSGSVKQLLIRLPASTMTSGNRPTREKRVASSPCSLNSANCDACCQEFDETAFKLARDKCQAWLSPSADSVIEKLNCDFAKPWFAQKKDGTVVKDLGNLTYEETALRLVRLMYVKHQSRYRHFAP